MTNIGAFSRLLPRIALCLWLFVLSPLVAAKEATPLAAGTDSIIAAEIVQDGETLFDGQPATILIRVTNKGDVALRVVKITPFPDTILLSKVAPAKVEGWQVAPHAILLQPVAITIDTARPLAAGKHLVGYVISAKQLAGAHPWSGDVAVSKEVTTGVPGMNEIQNVLQIPSFLLLPGLLICVSFSLLWRLRPEPPAKEPKSAFSLAADPKLWVAAITLSGIVVFLYPKITARFLAAPRSILYGYDLGDVGRVWVGSIMTGLAAAGLMLLGHWIWRSFCARRAFVAGEEPHMFLQRLARMKRSVQYPYVSETDGDKQFRLYRLEQDATAPELWAAPAIAIDIVPGHEGLVDMPALSTAAQAATVKPLLALLDAHLVAGHLTLRWQSYDAVSGPLQVDRTKFDNINVDRPKAIVDTG
jgi:hypothetical protein